MSPELMLASIVREWVETAVPDVPGLADRAACLAVNCYVSGASISEACTAARKYAECWARHPANQGPMREMHLVVAS